MMPLGWFFLISLLLVAYAAINASPPIHCTGKNKTKFQLDSTQYCINSSPIDNVCMTSAVTSVDPVERDRIIRECQNFFGAEWQTFIVFSNDQLLYNGKKYEIILKGTNNRQISNFSIHFKQNRQIPKPGSPTEYEDTDPIESRVLVQTITGRISPKFDLEVKNISSGTAAAVLSEFFDKTKFKDYIQAFNIKNEKEVRSAAEKKTKEIERRAREIHERREQMEKQKRVAASKKQVEDLVKNKMFEVIKKNLEDVVIPSISQIDGYSELSKKRIQEIVMDSSTKALIHALKDINATLLRSKFSPTSSFSGSTFNLHEQMKLPRGMHFE